MFCRRMKGVTSGSSESTTSPSSSMVSHSRLRPSRPNLKRYALCSLLMWMTRMTSFASCGLSAMIPSSVFLLADLVSRFIVPMKAVDRSMIAVLACRRPRETAGIQIVLDRAVTEDIDRRQLQSHHLLAVVDQGVEALLQSFAIGDRAQDGLHRIDLRAVPIDIEDTGKLRNDCAHDERVHVDE